MHYVVTFQKSDRTFTEQLSKLVSAKRWAALVERNGYTVLNIEKKTLWGKKGHHV